jgi:hypothetical protein
MCKVKDTAMDETTSSFSSLLDKHLLRKHTAASSAVQPLLSNSALTAVATANHGLSKVFFLLNRLVCVSNLAHGLRCGRSGCLYAYTKLEEQRCPVVRCWGCRTGPFWR